MSTPHILTGQSTADSRSALQALADSIAAQYFGTDCVAAELHSASVETETADSYQGRVSIANSFTADWEAAVAHRWESRSYGFPKCFKCGKEDLRTP